MRLLVVGAGGHARVVIDAAEAAGFEIAGVVGVPDDPTDVCGYPVSVLPDAIDADGFIVAIGDNQIRARRFEEFLAKQLLPLAVIHPSAHVSQRALIGPGDFVAAGALIGPGTVIGANAIVNTGAVVDHDCVIGDHVLIGPSASLCGNTRVGEGCSLGTGVNVIPARSIGEWSAVGAGAAVVNDIPAYSLCVGVPARVIRPIAHKDV